MVRLRRALTVGALAAACIAGAVAVGGCGATNAAERVIDPVAKAATISNQAPGMRMALSMQVSAAALPASITASGAGTFDTAGRTGSFNLAMDFGNIPQVAQALGTSTLQLEEITDGLTVYVKVPPALAGSMGLNGKQWAKINLASAAQAAGIPGISSLTGNLASSDPSQFLRYLRATSGGVTMVGSESVDGFPTTHYKAQIQLDRVPDVFPAASRTQARRTISSLEQLTHIHALPVDVWVDGQHLVRRMAFTINETVSGQSLSLAMRIDIPEYGPQPAPQLPPASQVTDLTGRIAATGSSG
jgi:hypothetical protein